MFVKVFKVSSIFYVLRLVASSSRCNNAPISYDFSGRYSLT